MQRFIKWAPVLLAVLILDARADPPSPTDPDIVWNAWTPEKRKDESDSGDLFTREGEQPANGAYRHWLMVRQIYDPVSGFFTVTWENITCNGKEVVTKNVVTHARKSGHSDDWTWCVDSQPNARWTYFKSFSR